MEKGLSDQSDAMSTAQRKCDSQQVTIEKLEMNVEALEKNQRSHNMLIKGLKGSNNENLRMIIDDMLRDMGVRLSSAG